MCGGVFLILQHEARDLLEQFPIEDVSNKAYFTFVPHSTRDFRDVEWDYNIYTYV